MVSCSLFPLITQVASEAADVLCFILFEDNEVVLDLVDGVFDDNHGYSINSTFGDIWNVLAQPEERIP